MKKHHQHNSSFLVRLLTVGIALWALGLFPASPLAAQDSAIKQPCSCAFTSLYNKNGWVIPGLRGATIAHPRGRYSIAGEQTKQPIFITSMKATQNRGTVTVVKCSREVQASTEVETLSVEVLRLWKFDVDGKVFAYGLSAGWLGPADASGRRPHLGTLSDFIFYDLDGSGRFSLLKTETMPFRLEVPEWVHNAGADSKSARKNGSAN